MSSSEILDIIAQKYFSSFIEPSGQIYGSGELGSIPDMFPMLLVAIRESLLNLDKNKDVIPEIEPGLSVTFDPLGKDKIGPNAFVSFTSRLRAGTFLVGSFSPVKYLNWIASRDLVQHISVEIDELFEDIQRSLDSLEWRDLKYDVITQIISERAHLITNALNSRSLHSFQSKEAVYYQTEQVLLVPFKVDYEKVPFDPVILDENVQFWRRDKDVGTAKDFFNIVKGVKNASLEPVKQLNRDTIDNETREKVRQYIEKLTEISQSPLQVRRAPLVLGKVKLGFDIDSEIQDLLWRFMGIQAIQVVIDTYIKMLKEVIETTIDAETVVNDFHDFLKGILVRKCSLGYISRRSFVKEFLDNLINSFRTFGKRISSLEKEVLNRAIIHIDQGNDLLEILHILEFSFSIKNLETYFYFWLQKYSGIMPEEINLMLNTGTIYIIYDYRKEKLFGTFIKESSTTKLDLGAMRELARKSIDVGELHESLIK